MANLVTLSSTTLPAAIGSSDGEIRLASASGVLAGMRLYVDREAMTVIALAVDPWVKVRRGTDGTGGAAHANGATAWIANGHELYTRDPQGLPPSELLVSPWINVLTGDLWFAQGDVVGPDGANQRWWQKQTATYSIGALGVRIKTLDPTVSTV